MKVLLVGAQGTIGRAVANELGRDHEVVEAGYSRAAYQVDIRSDASVQALFERVGPVDAIVSTVGKMHFGLLSEMNAEQFNVGLQDKLLGQVRLALIGQHYLHAGGSITLTSGVVGITSDVSIHMGSNASAVNSALEGFVHGAAVELAPSRINVVSPTVLSESLAQYGSFFSGFEAASGARVALAYRRSVDGAQTGQVLKVW